MKKLVFCFLLTISPFLCFAANDDIATAPELGTATSSDSMLGVDASAAAGSRMRRILFNGDSDYAFLGNGTWFNLSTALSAKLNISDIDDTPSDGNTTQPASSNSVYDGLAGKAPSALGTVRTTAGGGSTTAPPTEAVVGDAMAGTIAPAGIAMPGTATGPQGIVFLEDTDNGSNYVGFVAPAAITNSNVYSLPGATPTANHIVRFGTGGVVTGSDGVSRNTIPLEAVQPPLNGLLDSAITTPADADDLIYRRTEKALTLTDIHCQATGGGTITLTLQECDNATCASPSTIEGAITCDADGAEDDGTLTDGAIAAGAWIKVLFSAPSGTVSSLAWAVYGVQTW